MRSFPQQGESVIYDLNSIILAICSFSSDGWLVSLVTDDELRGFSANVYEAFCCQPDIVALGDNFYSEPDFVGGLVKFVQSMMD